MLKSISAELIRSQKTADQDQEKNDDESSSSSSESSKVDVYQWDVNRRDQGGLLKINDKSFAVLCGEDDRSTIDSSSIKKLPTTR